MCPPCGNRKLQADEGTPDPPGTGTVVQRDRALANGRSLGVHRGACQQVVVDFTFSAFGGTRTSKPVVGLFS